MTTFQNNYHYLKILLAFITGLAAVVTIMNALEIYPFSKEKEIFVESYSENLLSLNNKVDSLLVQYKGKEINNLWILRISIKNSGEKRIIGIGNYSDVYNNKLKLIIDKDFEILNYNVTRNDFGHNLFCLNNTFSILFNKWEPKEKIQINIMLLPISSNDISPSIRVNERDFIAGTIKKKQVDIAQIETSSKNLDWLIDLKLKYPSFIFKIAKYFGYFFFGMCLLMPFFFIFECLKTNINYSIWKQKYWKKYLYELEKIQISEKEEYKRKPYSIPKELQSQFSNLPDPPTSFGELLFLIGFSIIIFYPLLVYLMFAWNNL